MASGPPGTARFAPQAFNRQAGVAGLTLAREAFMHTGLRTLDLRPLLGLLALAVLVAGLGLAGCAQKPREQQGKLDTPDHHVLRGNDLLEQDRWSDAENEFNLALSLDRDYGPAMSGLAIVRAHAASQANPDNKGRLTEQALDLADKGLGKAKDDDAKRAARVAFIRVYTYAQSPESWLKKAGNEWEKAVDLDKRKQDPDPDFFMARAYRSGFEWTKAMDAYNRVLTLNKGRQQQANDELALVQKIVRAAPGSLHGKLIAIQPALSRADVAALLVEELLVSRLYERGNTQRFDTEFKAPTQAGGQIQVDTMQHMPEATDIANHPLRSDIEEVMRLKVLGLEPLPDRQFHPNETMSRAEFAMLIEDVLAHVTGEQGLKTKFFGQRSPFPDVRGDLPYFNAVQTAVTRNLMEPKNRIQGTFGPAEPVSGADALLAIRAMKDELRSYVR
jgi:Tfp pilus assembly protein PilF